MSNAGLVDVSNLSARVTAGVQMHIPDSVCMHILTYAYKSADAATLLCLLVTSTTQNQRFSELLC